MYTFSCMLPVLIELPFLKIYTFGVFLVLAFFWSAFLLWKNFLLTSYKEEEMFDGLFLSMAGGFFISRLVYVVFHFDSFGFDLLKFILINGYPGLSLYGFVGGFIVSFYVFTRSRKFRFSEIIDYFVPSSLLALGIGKLGSFFAGTEVGTRTDFFLKIKYVGFENMRHLTGVYECILFLLGALISYQLLFTIRRGSLQKGFNAFFFLWYLGFSYSLFDVIKEKKDLIISSISFNALVSYVLLLTFTVYFIYYFRSFIQKGAKNYVKTIFKGVHKKTQGANRKR